MIYIGIDPGVNGGLAAINTYPQNIGTTVMAMRMPETREELLKECALRWGSGSVAYLEIAPKVLKFRSKRDSGDIETSTGVAMINRSYERCAMAVIAAGIELVEVTPQKWQKFYGFKREGRSPTEWKNMLKDKAQRLFPNIKVTLAIADALLIANYARRVHV